MAVLLIARWEIKYADFVPLIREALPSAKKAGVQTVRVGRPFSRPNEVDVVLGFESFEALGKAQDALLADAEYQAVVAMAWEFGPLLYLHIVMI